MLSGLDVSHYQGQPDWAQVAAAGYAFAFCKASEGTRTTDKTFTRNWAGIGAAGMVRGAYHFGHANTDPVAQARRFCGLIGPLGARDLGPVLDLEVDDGVPAAEVKAWALAFLQEAERQVGRTPILYSYGPFLNRLGDRAELARFPLWLAAYRRQAPAPPRPWGAWTFWQHTSKAAIPGVDGNCDENFFAGDRATLDALAHESQEVVHPMYNPPIDVEPIVAACNDPVAGGAWALAESGAVYAWGSARGVRGTNGRPYFAGRKAARIDPSDKPGKVAVVTATTGEKYYLPDGLP